MKLSNKAALSLRSLSKCSFTPSKLRFFELRKPKISSCYTTSKHRGCPQKNLLDTTFVLIFHTVGTLNTLNTRYGVDKHIYNSYRRHFDADSSYARAVAS